MMIAQMLVIGVVPATAAGVCVMLYRNALAKERRQGLEARLRSLEGIDPPCGLRRIDRLPDERDPDWERG